MRRGFSFSSTSVPKAARIVARRLRRSSGESGEWSLIGRPDLTLRGPRADCRRRPSLPRIAGAPHRAPECSISTVTSWSPRLPSLAVKPRPLRRSTFPELVPLGIVSITGPSGRRHLHLRSEHRFLERYRQVEPDVVAVAPEEAVRRDLDRHDRVPASARTFLPFAGEADLGSVLEPLRKLEVDGLAIGERDPLRLQRDRIVERNLQPIGDVRAFLRRRARWRKPPNGTAAASPRAASGRTEQPFEEVAEVGRIGSAEIEILESLGRPAPDLWPARISAESRRRRASWDCRPRRSRRGRSARACPCPTGDRRPRSLREKRFAASGLSLLRSG